MLLKFKYASGKELNYRYVGFAKKLLYIPGIMKQICISLNYILYKY